MSIINQMLRDLDARETSVSPVAARANPVAAPSVRTGFRWVWALLLMLGGVAAYWAGTAVTPRPAAPALSATPIKAVTPLSRVPLTPIAPLNMQLADTVVTPREPVAQPTPPPIHTRQPVQLARDTVTLPPPAVAALPPTERGTVQKTHEMSPQTEAQRLYEEAQALHRAGQANAATGKLRQALTHDPGMQGARLLLADLLQESGQSAAALAQLKVGYDVLASEVLAIAAGRLLADQGKPDEALRWLARGQGGLRPADHALMGALWAQTQRHAEAVQAYQRAIDADPSQGGWLLGLGLSLEALGQVEASQAAYRKALSIGRFKPEVVKFLQQRSGAPGL